MPQYDFSCDCGYKESVIWPMNRSNEVLECSECGQKMYREYNFRTGNKDYSKPLVSDSLAINPEQISEHREHFPDVEVTSEGQPVFKNYKQHDSYLEKTGFRKVRQKIKPKGERIA